MIDNFPRAMSILVVEDDPGDFALIQAYIRALGLRHPGNQEPVVWAKTLTEGIQIVQRHHPSLVLLDLSLPDSFGLDTVKKMREVLYGSPIVVLTGNDDQTLDIATLEAGAQDYLIKGQFDQQILGRTIRYALARSALEKELERKNKELEDARQKAENAANTKAKFLANMSHEIRTPMNAVIGLTQLMLKTSLNEKQYDYLQKINSSATLLLGVLNDILDFSKIEAGQLNLEKTDFVLDEILDNISSITAFCAEEKNWSWYLM